jgi:hypothetical protein
MAIKVNGTTVINDSRALSNIASVDATTAAAIGAAGVGGGSAPEPPDWASPTTTLTSSQTWTKPGSIGNDDWVVFYAIGGGAAWANVSYKNGGSGGSAAVFAIKGSAIPSTVAIVVGAGGSGGSVDGGDTTMTFGSTVFVASGGVITGGGSLVEPPVGVFSMNSDGSDLDVALGTGLTAQGGGAGGDTLGLDISSTWGGGGGASASFSGAVARTGGTSIYAGNGGNGGSTPTNGSYPGGGAGGGYYGSSNPNTTGGNGNVRIYYGY